MPCTCRCLRSLVRSLITLVIAPTPGSACGRKTPAANDKAHGASATLIDRLNDNSDAFDVYVCRKCGQVAESLSPNVALTAQSSREWCRICRIGGFSPFGCVICQCIETSPGSLFGNWCR
jgi:hypothetical protein